LNNLHQVRSKSKDWNNLHQVRSKSKDWNNLHQVRSKSKDWSIEFGSISTIFLLDFRGVLTVWDFLYS
jgi:hypothetical protein